MLGLTPFIVCRRKVESLFLPSNQSASSLLLGATSDSSDEDGAPDAEECEQQAQQEHEDEDYSEDDADDETLMEQEEENYDDTAQWLERADRVCQLEGELEDSCAAFSAKVPKAWRRRAW